MELLLRKFNPSLSEEEVHEKAGTLYSATKGTKMWVLLTNSVYYSPNLGF